MRWTSRMRNRWTNYPPTMADLERHTRAFEEFDLRVDVGDDGTVLVTFLPDREPKVVIAVAELGKVVEFVEKHGEVTVCPK